MSDQSTLRATLRARHGAPSTRGKAIRLFCAECCGGEMREARTCATRDCFLWPFGIAARYERRKANDTAPDPRQPPPRARGEEGKEER